MGYIDVPVDMGIYSVIYDNTSYDMFFFTNKFLFLGD